MLEKMGHMYCKSGEKGSILIEEASMSVKLSTALVKLVPRDMSNKRNAVSS